MIRIQNKSTLPHMGHNKNARNQHPQQPPTLPKFSNTATPKNECKFQKLDHQQSINEVLNPSSVPQSIKPPKKPHRHVTKNT